MKVEFPRPLCSRCRRPVEEFKCWRDQRNAVTVFEAVCCRQRQKTRVSDHLVQSGVEFKQGVAFQ